MKRVFAVMTALFALMIFSGSKSLPYAEKPTGHIDLHDGYSLVSFDIPENARITYTVDGTAPDRKSQIYPGGSIRFDKTGTLRLRVAQKNTKPLLCSYNVRVESRHIIKPKPLKSGDTIGVVAPAKYIEGDFTAGVDLLKKYGYKVKIGETCYLKYNGFAGTPEQRAADVNRFFADDEVDAILCLRGGSGSMDIIDKLDYDLIAAHPKLFIGFSDITAVHSAVYNKCGLVTVHGSMISNFVKPYTYYTKKQFFGNLKRSKAIGVPELPDGTELKALSAGTAEGRIVGGNLSLICELADTQYAVNGRDSIIFIEDIHETSYSIEKMLQTLTDKGLFESAEAIVFGEFSDMTDSDRKRLDEVLEKFAADCGKPCISGLPAGHDDDNMFLPLGVKARVTAKTDGTAEIEILESVFQKQR